MSENKVRVSIPLPQLRGIRESAVEGFQRRVRPKSLDVLHAISVEQKIPRVNIAGNEPSGVEILNGVNLSATPLAFGI